MALELLSPWIRELQIYRELLIEKLKEEVDELAGKDERCTIISLEIGKLSRKI